MSRGTEQATSSVETANKAGSSLETITSTIGRINQMNEQIATIWTNARSGDKSRWRNS